jgi:expansin (peptidoglycan-binding protein)
VEVSANGKKQIAHVVTYGQETGPDDIDVSPELDAALDGSAARKGTWQFVTCPTTAPIYYNFDGRDWTNPWYFRVWVRNARQPVSKVEFKVGSGAWTSADTQTDGAWQANGADFSKGFSLRIGSLDAQSVEDTLPGIGTFDASTAIASHTNFQ